MARQSGRRRIRRIRQRHREVLPERRAGAVSGQPERTDGSARRILDRRGSVPRQGPGDSELPHRFRHGVGDHDPCLFKGTERFFRAGYNANLLSSWLPALDGVVEKLQSGGRVADVGCGHGVTTILMAQAFPNSEFVGIDYHDASIETARDHAAQSGVRNASFAGGRRDLIRGHIRPHRLLRLSARHGESLRSRPPRQPGARSRWPLHACRARRRNSLSDNLNPVGRVFYGASSLICVPVSLAHQGPALGAQAGERRLKEVMVDDGGFTRFRRATETPFNLVFEARP